MNLDDKWLAQQLDTLQPSSEEWEELFAMFGPPAHQDYIKSFEQFRQLVPINESFTLLELRRGKFGPSFGEVYVTLIYEMVKIGILKIVGKVPYGKRRQCNLYIRLV